MRMNKKTHAAGTKRPAPKKKDRSAKNDFRKNPFVNLKEDPERSCPGENRTEHMGNKEAEQIAEMIGCVLEQIFSGHGEGGMRPMMGVIELTPENQLSMEIRDLEDRTEKCREDIVEKRRKVIEKSKEIAGKIREQEGKDRALPPADGCGEEVFLEMLGDLNFMAEMILEADHLMKMVSEEGVDPENARCVTYLSVRDAGDIMEKWDKYRRCEI
ncbi:MAG: hypothetical protein IKG67_14050 [Parasporobacterium sp.]|jgi:hypothetical protein|nr:hypothetical protein [Lachnospiraceae bacterium]MBR3403348.1 hypothetical protein [Parasporobacterium sp.]